MYCQWQSDERYNLKDKGWKWFPFPIRNVKWKPFRYVESFFRFFWFGCFSANQVRPQSSLISLASEPSKSYQKFHMKIECMQNSMFYWPEVSTCFLSDFYPVNLEGPTVHGFAIFTWNPGPKIENPWTVNCDHTRCPDSTSEYFHPIWSERSIHTHMFFFMRNWSIRNWGSDFGIFSRQKFSRAYARNTARCGMWETVI